MSLDQINLQVKQVPSRLDLYYADVNWEFLEGEGEKVCSASQDQMGLDLHMHPLVLAFQEMLLKDDT